MINVCWPENAPVSIWGVILLSPFNIWFSIIKHPFLYTKCIKYELDVAMNPVMNIQSQITCSVTIRPRKKTRFVSHTHAHKYVYSLLLHSLCAEPNFLLFFYLSGSWKVGQKHYKKEFLHFTLLICTLLIPHSIFTKCKWDKPFFP